MVEVHGELPVGADLEPHYVGYYLLVGGAEAELAVVAVLYPQKLLAVLVPPAALLPKLRGEDKGHGDLLGPGPVHLLPYYVLHLLYHPETQRQEVIDARGDLPYHAGPDHEGLAHDLGVGRGLLQRGNQHFRKTHAFLLAEKNYIKYFFFYFLFHFTIFFSPKPH